MRKIALFLERTAHYGTRPALQRKIYPYRVIVEARLQASPLLTSVRLTEEIKVAGYDGGYTPGQGATNLTISNDLAS